MPALFFTSTPMSCRQNLVLAVEGILLAVLLIGWIKAPVAEALNTGSIDFESSSQQYAVASSSVSLDILSELTIESWIKWESKDSDQGLVTKWNYNANQRSYALRWYDENGVKKIGLMVSADGSSFGVKSFTFNPNIGDWYHIAVRYSATSGDVRFFINGTEYVPDFSAGSFGSIYVNSGDLAIGSFYSGSPTALFDGRIDDVRVWNVARSQSQIAADMNRELEGSEPGLVAYWKFNDSSLEDATANNNDLTNVNGASFTSEIPFVGVPEKPNPVIIVPGILGSSEHNGMLQLDPILHTYDDLIATLDVNGYSPDVDLFVFPYNWRRSNVETASLLKQKIDTVKSICSCEKVDLVAHSMGGLIARQYIQSSAYDGDVDQLIFIGTPHLGAPNAYLMWEGGYVGTNLSDRILNRILRQEAKKKGYSDLVEYAQLDPVSSVQQLLPVFDYLFDDSTLRSYPENYPTNTFIENLRDGLGALLSLDVSLYNFIGETGAATIAGINVIDSVAAPPKWVHGEPRPINPYVVSNGDGTVPIGSASVVTSNIITLATPHRILPDAAKGEVVKILKGSASPTLVDSIEEVNLRLLMIQMFSPADLLVIAPDGKKVGRGEGGSEINEIPLAFYTGSGAESEYITIPNPLNGVYTIQSTGVSTGSYSVEAHYLSEATTTTAAYVGETMPGMATNLTLALDAGNLNAFELVGPDLDPPFITIESPKRIDYARSIQLPVSVTAEDASQVESLKTTVGITTIPNVGSLDLFLYKLGNYTLTAQAEDVNGNATTSIVTFRVIATATSTLADVERAYREGWMTKKVRDYLVKKMKTLIVLKKKMVTIIERKEKKNIEVIEQVIDKVAAKVLLKELDKYRGKGLDERAYQILREDILWLVNE